MTLRDFLLAVAGVTIISWLAWVTALLYIDPSDSGVVGITVFYISLFLSLVGTFSLAGLGVRVAAKRLNQENMVAFRFVSPSIRQSLWFALLVVVSLFLLAQNLLRGGQAYCL